MLLKMKLKETYNLGTENSPGIDVEVWICDCGREHHIQAGGDIACCPCEFCDCENE